MVRERGRGEPRDVLVNPDSQDKGWLFNHFGKRHPLPGFWTRGEHEADHRLHQNYLDHTHEK